MSRKDFLRRLRKSNSRQLIEKIKNMNFEIKKERSKPKIKQDFDKILSLEAKKSEVELVLAAKKNEEFEETQDKKLKRNLK